MYRQESGVISDVGYAIIGLLAGFSVFIVLLLMFQSFVMGRIVGY